MLDMLLMWPDHVLPSTSRDKAGTTEGDFEVKWKVVGQFAEGYRTYFTQRAVRVGFTS